VPGYGSRYAAMDSRTAGRNGPLQFDDNVVESPGFDVLMGEPLPMRRFALVVGLIGTESESTEFDLVWLDEDQCAFSFSPFHGVAELSHFDLGAE